jgi:glycine oxidase
VTPSATPDVIVVGGGIIGLAVAHALQARGRDVLVLDAGDPGAWNVAAGMLAPVTEAEFGEDPRLGLESLGRYPAFCHDLGVALARAGTLAVARDRDEAEALDRLHAHRTRLGLDAERLLPSAARRREPALAPNLRLALDAPGDLSVDPRALVAALRDRVEVRRARVVAVAPHSVTLAPGDVPGGASPMCDLVNTTLEAGHVVVATGAHALGAVPVRPVKGQVLRLRDPRGPGLVTRTIRGESCYLVPRADGTYVLGATVEERGWDPAPTAGGVYELLRDMSELVPGVLELELEEVLVGFRPGTPDNRPAIGALDGVLYATGHWRNGVLLAPITAELIADLIDGIPLPDWAAACDAARFTRTTA